MLFCFLNCLKIVNCFLHWLLFFTQYSVDLAAECTLYDKGCKRERFSSSPPSVARFYICRALRANKAFQALSCTPVTTSDDTVEDRNSCFLKKVVLAAALRSIIIIIIIIIYSPWRRMRMCHVAIRSIENIKKNQEKERPLLSKDNGGKSFGNFEWQSRSNFNYK